MDRVSEKILELLKKYSYKEKEEIIERIIKKNPCK